MACGRSCFRIKTCVAIGKRLDKIADPIAHASIGLQRLAFVFGAACQPRRVIESVMHAVRRTRAGGRGAVANGHDEVEVQVGDVCDGLRRLSGHIHAAFAHDRNGARIDGVRRGASRKRFDAITQQMPGPGLGHLAAAGIAGADEQDTLARLGHDETACVNVSRLCGANHHAQAASIVRAAKISKLAITVYLVRCME